VYLYCFWAPARPHLLALKQAGFSDACTSGPGTSGRVRRRPPIETEVSCDGWKTCHGSLSSFLQRLSPLGCPAAAAPLAQQITRFSGDPDVRHP
jgi:hypothetical protein